MFKGISSEKSDLLEWHIPVCLVSTPLEISSSFMGFIKMLDFSWEHAGRSRNHAEIPVNLNPFNGKINGKWQKAL